MCPPRTSESYTASGAGITVAPGGFGGPDVPGLDRVELAAQRSERRRRKCAAPRPGRPRRRPAAPCPPPASHCGRQPWYGWGQARRAAGCPAASGPPPAVITDTGTRRAPVTAARRCAPPPAAAPVAFLRQHGALHQHVARPVPQEPRAVPQRPEKARAAPPVGGYAPAPPRPAPAPARRAARAAGTARRPTAPRTASSRGVGLPSREACAAGPAQRLPHTPCPLRSPPPSSLHGSG